MGGEGLTKASKVAILNANYIAARLSPYYSILYRGVNQLVAHECIVDFRPFKNSAGIEVEDVAKRLMDYGFHAPTVSFPVPGTMMIEPTETESKATMDEFIAILRQIDKEISENPKLVQEAPHTTPVRRIDEVVAARQPNLRYRAGQAKPSDISFPAPRPEQSANCCVPTP